ncbi:hypothetical protein HHK36_000019 [Tetracentron sinense]|uniref:Uncharacterized protein n=1 Tax=Tetracentron sinense TaxID=13715 RepID=A0A835DQG2_TETSI|nr:hypothetical protein HHK36_000019 [Tetracentron sinense]
MEEIIRSPENCRNQTITEPITSTTCTSWKLYDNPFYYSQHHHHHHPHPIHLPLSARRIAASLWDLSFFRPIMNSELDIAQARIFELKTQLEFERKLRKKVVFTNKKLAREFSEERNGRQAMKRVCEELAKEIVSNKAEMERMRREMEEERKMLRMAEVLREERVQMKLTEAKILLEEKLFELKVSKGIQIEPSTSKMEQKKQENKLGLCEEFSM